MKALNKVPLATSITHQHIAAIINTSLSKRPLLTDQKKIKVLDMGCGNGKLISYLLDSLPLLQPDYIFEFYGFDVENAEVQVSGFMDKTIDELSNKYPYINWEARMVLVRKEDNWPYKDGTFDFITSNQVMEHVMNHEFVFNEIARCLSPGGVSINLFPTREMLFEGHALMPIIHKIRDVDKRARYMRYFTKIGFSKHYFQDMERHGWKSIDEYAYKFSRILESDTKYISGRELLSLAEKIGLKASFLHTKDFYRAKYQSFFGKRTYSYSDWGCGEQFAFGILKYISSITLVLQKF
jgi:2-polyprenyl-3-methyl-5-hydroxy-6-metoxy-1,4-benzoquinol methylase